MSPLSAPAVSEPIIDITPGALSKLTELRDEEPEGDSLGLRLEIASTTGQEFQYDLSFDEYRKAAISDEVRNHEGLRIIIPGKDVEFLRGATLDYSDAGGLVLRNPNRPAAPVIEGLTSDDQLSAEVEAVISAEVNPALASHGGYVTFVGHDGEGTAYLTMGGGCHGCAMSRMTMLEGVQTMVVSMVEGISKVSDLTDHSVGENPYFS
jgi:Fe/S biogenesis protein NfuA